MNLGLLNGVLSFITYSELWNDNMKRKESSHFKLFCPPEDDEQTGNQEYSNTELLNFVDLFPPELSDKLFTFLTTKDLMSCCQVSIAWRHVINNNRQWMRHCKYYGFAKTTFHETDPTKWSLQSSHVDSMSRLRKVSPAFMLPPIASTRIQSLCIWGRYFRQCLHLQRNWRQGRYVMHKIKLSESSLDICTCADSNTKVLAMGSNSGCVYIWSIKGMPKQRELIAAVRQRAEIEQIRLTEHVIAVLYEIGLIRCYKIPNDYLTDKSKSLDMILQVRIWGLPTPNILNEYTLFWQDIQDIQTLSPSDSITQTISEGTTEENDTEQWIRELFRSDPWFDTEYLTSDMTFLVTENHLVVSGYDCNCFLIFGFETKEFLKKVQVPQGVQICRKAIISSSVVYLTTKKMNNNQRFEPIVSIFMYDLYEPYEYREYRSQDLTEEIRIDLKNLRIVWISQDVLIYGGNLLTKESLFIKTSEAYVDNLIIHEDYIVYHQYDGYITALNWIGEVIYITEALTGISRGFQGCGNILASGGDGLQLSIYDIHSGKRLHKVFHQPSRIEYLFLHETKIICIGRDEPAILIGYW